MSLGRSVRWRVNQGRRIPDGLLEPWKPEREGRKLFKANFCTFRDQRTKAGGRKQSEEKYEDVPEKKETEVEGEGISEMVDLVKWQKQ